MNKYIKLLEDFDAETDLDPIMPIEEEDETEEAEEQELEVIGMESEEGTPQWYVVDLNTKKGVAGPFVEKSDAVREIEVMQGKEKKPEHKHDDVDEVDESRMEFDPSELIFMAAQYTEADLEPLAGQMWSEANDLVTHILGDIDNEADKAAFLKDAKEAYPEITLAA